jgi:hypothetical protein
MTDLTASSELRGDEVLHEFGELTKSTALSRREIVNELARRHGASPKQIYAAIEQGKVSVK